MEARFQFCLPDSRVYFDKLSFDELVNHPMFTKYSPDQLRLAPNAVRRVAAASDPRLTSEGLALPPLLLTFLHAENGLGVWSSGAGSVSIFGSTEDTTYLDTFILEAARELEAKYAQLGISYALHVDRTGKRYPRFARLAKTSSVVVTDDFPIEATKQWTERLAEAKWSPIVLVDTACIVPSRLIGQAYDRAFEFRDATTKQYRDRVNREWPHVLLQPFPQTCPLKH